MYASRYASGQGSDLDQSGDQFVELLLELRVVLLQDSALLMPRFPELPLWKHPVFSHEDWSRFAEQVREAEAREEEPEHVLLARTQPLVASEIAALNRNLSGLVQHGTTAVSDAVKDLKNYLVTAITTLAQQIAQNRVPQTLLLVPPEAVKEPVLNESFGSTLSAAALPSHSPSACELASNAHLTTATPGPSLQPNAQATPVAAALQHEPTDCPEGWPVDPTTPSMKSMAEVWQEWHYGLGGNPSVMELDKRFGNKWRYNSKIRQRCSNRKRLIVAAREEASRRGVPVEEIVSLIDGIKARDGHRLSPDKISRLLSGNDKKSLSSLL
jgi:hypothetical protein